MQQCYPPNNNMPSLTHTAHHSPEGFRWLTYQHCDTGEYQIRRGFPGKPDPKVPRGWVLLKSTQHNSTWNTPAKIQNNILP